MFRGDANGQKKHTAGMQQIKSTHRPRPARCRTLACVGHKWREETTSTGWSVLMAVGVKKMVSAPWGGQWRPLNSTNATKGGTHDRRSATEHQTIRTRHSSNSEVVRSGKGSVPELGTSAAGRAPSIATSVVTCRRRISIGRHWQQPNVGCDEAVVVCKDWPKRISNLARRALALSIYHPLCCVFSSCLRRTGGGLGHFWLVTQNRPLHIRAQVFATHQAVGGLFDLEAALGGNSPYCITPKTDGLRCYAQRFCQPGCVAHVLNCDLNWCHAFNSTHVDNNNLHVYLIYFQQLYSFGLWQQENKSNTTG